MTVSLIANVGQSDLQLDGALLCKTSFRAECEAIESDYANRWSGLSAPILEPVLKYLSVLHGTVDNVVLVATDQTGSAHRSGDTLPAARILAQLLKQTFPRVIAGAITPVAIREHPHDYAAMRDFFERSIVTLPQVQADQVYVVCTGGTPACNTSLLLTAVEAFRDRCGFIYVPRGSSAVELPDVGRRILRSFRNELLRGLLEQHDFAGVAVLAGLPEAPRELAKAASMRLNLDFESSYCTLAQCIRKLTPPSELRELFQEGAQLADAQSDAILREVYWHAMLNWRRDECADFLGRVWRLREEALLNFFMNLTGIDFGGKDRDRLFKEWVGQQPGLEEYLKGKVGAKLELKPNTFILQLAMNHLLRHPEALPTEKRPLAESILRSVNRLEKASELRNASVIAHGFRGLSRNSILEALQGNEDDLKDCLKDLMAAMGIEPGVDPYERYANAILALAAKET